MKTCTLKCSQLKFHTLLSLPMFFWKEKKPTNIIFKIKWKGGHSPARRGIWGAEEIFWVHFRYYWYILYRYLDYCCPPVCYTCYCHGALVSIVCCWCPLSVSSASPATRIPLAQKGKENPITRFPPWPKTVGAKGSGLPPPHVDAPRPRGTAGPPSTAGGISIPSPAPQPSPSEYGGEEWPLFYLTSGGVWPRAETTSLMLRLGGPSRTPTLGHKCFVVDVIKLVIVSICSLEL